jgi:hypothetical protein
MRLRARHCLYPRHLAPPLTRVALPPPLAQPGVELENEDPNCGGPGSHWEARLLDGELMEASLTAGPFQLSSLTLALFEDRWVRCARPAVRAPSPPPSPATQEWGKELEWERGEGWEEGGGVHADVAVAA